ncbi:hypothetical protein A4X13_0g1509 [Tilletia indica]|uniref:Major facilitator superfamily (MFS) profile domain-containing protein n=1 Tax=Tilletia indica TaxID=43049 RepID=A0A177TVN8_9BASI|nr:hypothetical protein A4X13_0g1509 [Tilletia indica]
MSDPLRSPSRAPAATSNRSASPSPLRYQQGQAQQQQQPSAHIRFEDDLLHPPPSSSSSSSAAESPSSRTVDLPTGPLIDYSEDDNNNNNNNSNDQPSPILQRDSSPNNNKNMSVMREQRNYGSTLSVSNEGTPSRGSPSTSRDRSPSGPAGPSSASAAPERGGRASGPGRIELPPTLGAPFDHSPRSPNTAAAAGGGGGGRQRSFSFKKRAPSLGAASSAAGAQQRLQFSNGARKLLNRASLGFFGNDAPDLDAQGGGGDSPSSGPPPLTPFTSAAVGARGRWRNLRRTQTLSVHQPNEGVLSPLNPDAYDDGYGYGHNTNAAEEDKPRIPQMLPSTKPDPDSTPIPTLPFVVLCVMIFGEFSSAGVAGPFLFFMINEFKVGGEAEVGFWAGIVSAVFFFAQFLTSMLWASVANRHGRRVVLLVSLVGNCASLILFGTSTNLKTAIAVRLTQGLFNGAVGVAKGAVRDLTDPTNEARAYGIMGFCWGMGGIIGPILGGVLEHPVEKYPALFGNSKLFAQYPYLLPCLVTACSTGLGAILTLFLGRDGGPRSGVIALPEKDTERAAATVQTRVVRTAAANVGSFGRSAGKRISGYFSNRGGNGAGPSGTSGNVGDESVGEALESNISLEQTGHRGKDFPRTFTQQVDWETGGPPSPAESDATIVTRTNAAMDSGFDDRSVISRAFSRTSARRQSVAGGGSAYGYSRRQSRSSQRAAYPARFGSSAVARHRDQSAASDAMQSGYRDRAAPQSVYAPDFEEEMGAGGVSGLSFAQRFLLANDDAVLSLTDLWVAAAIGEDGVNALDEDVFLDDDEEDEDVDYEEDEDEEAISLGTDEDDISDDEEGGRGGGSGVGSSGRRAFNALNQPSEDSPLLARRPLVPAHFAHRKLSLAGRSDAESSAFSSGTRQSQHTGRGRARGGTGPSRRRGRSGSASTATGGGGGRVPLLFAQAGVELPHGVGSPIRSPAPPEHRVPSGGYFPSSSAGGGGEASGAASNNFNTALAGIPEGHSVRNSLHAVGHGRQTPQLATLPEGAATSAFTTRTGGYGAAGGISGISAGLGQAAAPQSVWALLPLAIVAQYGIMSWHSSTFEQVFMAFLVTDVKSGGLGLTAAHFAELIAAMAVCQMVFQFQFYPTVGPPRGKYTHLTMFRMGLALYLPVYTLFPWLRNFITSTDATVMSGMIFFASLRWLANVTAFTAVTVLMNAMTPPHLIPLTNGLAQTVSSFMRCVGPIVGGLVWAKSIDGGPDGHAWPFNYHLGFWVVGLVAFAGFLHSLTIR